MVSFFLLLMFYRQNQKKKKTDFDGFVQNRSLVASLLVLCSCGKKGRTLLTIVSVVLKKLFLLLICWLLNKAPVYYSFKCC
jgi:hypothetical protein